MIGGNTTNSIFDFIFVGLQVAAVLYWLISHLGFSILPQWWGVVSRVITAIILIAAPLGWYLVDPPSNGFEGAGRLMAYGLFLPLNGLGLGTLLWRLHRRDAREPKPDA